jgi:hypothetical protein
MGMPFGVLSREGRSKIQVFHCLGCDHYTEFGWSKAKRRFVQLPWHGQF